MIRLEYTFLYPPLFVAGLFDSPGSGLMHELLHDNYESLHDMGEQCRGGPSVLIMLPSELTMASSLPLPRCSGGAQVSGDEVHAALVHLHRAAHAAQGRRRHVAALVVRILTRPAHP